MSECVEKGTQKNLIFNKRQKYYLFVKTLLNINKMHEIQMFYNKPNAALKLPSFFCELH